MVKACKIPKPIVQICLPKITQNPRKITQKCTYETPTMITIAQKI